MQQLYPQLHRRQLCGGHLLGTPMKQTMLLLVVLMLVSCAKDPTIGSARASSVASKTCRRVRMHASWAEWYRSLDELRNASDLAVLANVTDVGEGYRQELPREKSEHLVHYTPVFSTVTVSIESVVWQRNSKGDVPDTIRLTQTGGVFDGVAYEIGDDPLFQVGTQTVLFLKQVEPGRYRVSGGPSGRFYVENETVRTIVADGVRLPPVTTVAQLTALL